MDGIDRNFWRGRRVLVTGHTGFKGSWLCLWLASWGARVSGYSLPPPTNPSLFELAQVAGLLENSVVADIRDRRRIAEAVEAARPEIVVHMAAQPLVRASYEDPAATYETNVLGTVYLLEAIRHADSVRAVVNVTTDKCYENREWCWGYRENEALGGYDPYASSKACSELVTSAYRRSFFPPSRHSEHGVALASARSGNVIGGGDWAKDRLLPDCVRAFLAKEAILIRSPHAVRPWQHVLDPLAGYLLLAERLATAGPEFAESWNFGPDDAESRSVEWLVDRACQLWGECLGYRVAEGDHPHEASWLRLDCAKAKQMLGWRARLDIAEAVRWSVDWYRTYRDGGDLSACCRSQMAEYEKRMEA